jgi:predicted CXXCH cytochrome family protein
MAKNRFIIRRTDQLQGVDDVIIESEGLTIGRLIGNDLVLNNRAVSRTHGGIKEIGGQFWIFNLSHANGTVVNGSFIEGWAVLQDGDVIQIGPYLLTVNYIQQALQIKVEMDIELNLAVQQAEAASPQDGGEATVMMKVPVVTGKQAPPKRQAGTGALALELAEEEQRALDIFWAARKREAGKMAALTPLHPRGGQKLGRAQNNWRPTLDLRKPWRKSYFTWGALIVTLMAIAAVIIYEQAYAPGAVADAHWDTFSKEELLRRNIAMEQNAACSTCHSVTETMQTKCTACHTTTAAQVSPTNVKPGFDPGVYPAHERERVECSECHTEHQGPKKEAGLVSYGLCYNCHNGVYKIKTDGDVGPAGTVLPIPHGGTVGYPVENGQWTWKALTAEQLEKRRMPRTLAAQSGFDQFHAIHLLGKMSQMGQTGRGLGCSDCHTAGTNNNGKGDALFKSTPRNECGKCHGLSFTSNAIQTVQANCSTCHLQHDKSENLAQFISDAARDGKKLRDFAASLSAQGGGGQAVPIATTAIPENVGAAGVRRQDVKTLSLKQAGPVGGLPWYGWVAVAAALPLIGLFVMIGGTLRRRSYLQSATREVRPEPVKVTAGFDLDRLAAEGPEYPHPVINTETCIGCHACVDACPHDVLKIVNGKSMVVAMDQCMEDTSCQVECPTSPKSCIVVNTTKKIPARKVPVRNQRLETNVPGVYMIGDVSGTPLIKNAINEGRRVIDSIKEDLARNGRNGQAEYDVAIIGLGPAGLSAAVLAKQEGLSYVALEQDKLAATIQQTYQAGKFVFFTPADKPVEGGIPLIQDEERPEGNVKESMLKGWFDAMMQNGVEAHEEEGCKDIKNEGGVFRLITEKEKFKEPASYTARKIILAIGNRGAPMKLGVPGEDLTIFVPAREIVANHCPKCGLGRNGAQQFCVNCGTRLPVRTVAAHEESRVQYKLTDPKEYIGKKCIVVGAGNSAIEVAVGLTGFERDGEDFKFNEGAEVTLIVRSDFKGDLALGNKMNVYDCIDAGRIKAYFGCAIKEITQDEVVIMNVRTKEEKARVKNDYIFALIGGEKPTKFLEGIGVKIGSESE